MASVICTPGESSGRAWQPCSRMPSGSRRPPCTCCHCAIAGVGKVREQQDPICSLYLTHLPGKVEIRFRDHGARRWKTVRGNRVQTVRV